MRNGSETSRQPGGHAVLRHARGERVRLEEHFVLYSLSTFKRCLTFGDGGSGERTAAPGQTGFSEAQIHIGENVGDTDTHVLMIELKEPRPSKSPK